MLLTITGERKAPEVKGQGYLLCEVCYRPFPRSITLPSSVGAAKVEASYDNGVLDVTLPKAKEAVARKVQVKAK